MSARFQLENATPSLHLSTTKTTKSKFPCRNLWNVPKMRIYSVSFSFSFVPFVLVWFCFLLFLAIVASVIGSIVLAGLIMLIIWKVVTTIHDRKEFAKFEKERMNPKWHRGENPLFKNPTSHFNNPMFENN